MTQKELFDSLSAAESYRVCDIDDEIGIGIYNEKRLHRILKRTFCQREDCFEIKVGRYIADIAEAQTITEIQCGSMMPLEKKLEYYLKSTDYSIRVVLPIIVRRALIRADRETGEVMRVRTSPKKGSEWNALAKMYPISRLLTSNRLSICIMLIETEEYRYSEAVRYRKKGKYDAELFPTALVDSIVLEKIEDYLRFLPNELREGEFSAADFAPFTPLRGRDIYSALNTLSAIGVLKREKIGGRVRYCPNCF